MIEKVYSYISSNFRELHCKLVSNQSTKSIKAEFFVDRLIDLYVTDVRRQRALKAVIARKTSESNAGNELIWKHVKEEYIKA
jgi:TolB-like protein